MAEPEENRPDPSLIDEIEGYLQAHRRTVIDGTDLQELWREWLAYLRGQAALTDMAGQLMRAVWSAKVWQFYDEITRAIADRRSEEWHRTPVPPEIPEDIVEAVLLKRWLTEHPGELPPK